MNQEIQFCITPDNVKIAYAKVGEGPPFVRAAHWMTHLEYDLQSPVWGHWLRFFSQNHKLIRYDMRGCGLSDRTINNPSLEDWVQDLAAVVDAVGLEQFPLIGMSQGGSIAIEYAARHPERVSHLILYGTYLRGKAKRNPTERDKEEFETLIKLIELGWGRENPAYRQVFASLFMPGGDKDKLDWFSEIQRLSASPENAANIVRVLNEIDVRETATSLEIPVLVLHSKGDARIPFEEGRLAAALIPKARFVPLESTNHLLLENEPAWHDFTEEIYRFLNVEVSPLPTPKTLSATEKTYWDLTDREREVLKLMAQGYQNPEIAKTLVLSPKTIRNYVSNIFSKLDVTSRGEAIVLAREAGFIEEGE